MLGPSARGRAVVETCGGGGGQPPQMDRRYLRLFSPSRQGWCRFENLASAISGETQFLCSEGAGAGVIWPPHISLL